jgi:hypothetical protein
VYNFQLTPSAEAVTVLTGVFEKLNWLPNKRELTTVKAELM